MYLTEFIKQYVFLCRVNSGNTYLFSFPEGYVITEFYCIIALWSKFNNLHRICIKLSSLIMNTIFGPLYVHNNNLQISLGT